MTQDISHGEMSFLNGRPFETAVCRLTTYPTVCELFNGVGLEVRMTRMIPDKSSRTMRTRASTTEMTSPATTTITPTIKMAEETADVPVDFRNNHCGAILQLHSLSGPRLNVNLHRVESSSPLRASRIQRRPRPGTAE